MSGEEALKSGNVMEGPTNVVYRSIWTSLRCATLVVCKLVQLHHSARVSIVSKGYEYVVIASAIGCKRVITHQIRTSTAKQGCTYLKGRNSWYGIHLWHGSQRDSGGRRVT